MVSKALIQLFQDGDWGNQIILLVDLPPGNGCDIHLTLVDKIPAGVIVVSTPQEAASPC
jgi:ATP-binding protein involved in chromosome partitioning